MELLSCYIILGLYPGSTSYVPFNQNKALLPISTSLSVILGFPTKDQSSMYTLANSNYALNHVRQFKQDTHPKHQRLNRIFNKQWAVRKSYSQTLQ